MRQPSLRNLPRTGPYMHNGLFDLRGVLNMYNVGMPTIPARPVPAGGPAFPVKSPLLKPLGLNLQDFEDLTAFLESPSRTIWRIRGSRSSSWPRCWKWKAAIPRTA